MVATNIKELFEMGKLLDQLRNERDQREAEVKAPVIKALNNERRAKEKAINDYHQIEFKLGEDIIKYGMEQAKNEIAQILNEQLFKTLKSRRAGVFTIQLDLNLLLMASPDQQLRLLFSEYARMSRPVLKIENNSPMDNRLEIIKIHIPELNINLPLHK
jgi:hypothetical protein